MATQLNFDTGALFQFLNYLQNQKSPDVNPYSEIVNPGINPEDVPYDIGTKYGSQYSDPSTFSQLPYLPKGSAGKKANALYLGERGLQDRRGAQFGEQAQKLAELNERFKREGLASIGGGYGQVLQAQQGGKNFDPNSVTPEQLGRLLEQQNDVGAFSIFQSGLPKLNQLTGSGQDLQLTQNELLVKKAKDLLSRPEDITRGNQAGLRKLEGESYAAPYVAANQFRVGPGGEEAYLAPQGFSEEQQFTPFTDPKTGQIINLPGQVTRRTTPGGVINLKPKGVIPKLSYDLSQTPSFTDYGGYLSSDFGPRNSNPKPLTEPAGKSAPANAAGTKPNLNLGGPVIPSYEDFYRSQVPSFQRENQTPILGPLLDLLSEDKKIPSSSVYPLYLKFLEEMKSKNRRITEPVRPQYNLE